MAAFVRGQFILCCTLAVLYLGLGLSTDIDPAVLVGVLSGLLFVVPYLGTFFGLWRGPVSLYSSLVSLRRSEGLGCLRCCSGG